MKKFISLMIGLAFTFGLMVNANAAEEEVKNYADLKACLTSSTDATCKIVSSDGNPTTITTDTTEGYFTFRITDGVTKIIDLNGNNLNLGADYISIKGGTLRIEGSGTTEGDLSIGVTGSADASQTNFSTLYVGPDVTIKDKQYSVAIYQAKDTKVAYGVNVTIDGATLEAAYGALYINGTAQNLENAPVIKINDGSILTGTGNEQYDGVGIYGAGYANWTIGKANITGNGGGLAIKAGKWVIDGAYVKATGEDSTPTAGFSNGINASGAAIQLESNSDYAGNIDITINSGKFESLHSYAFYEYLGKGTETNVAKVAINGGEFIPGTNSDNEVRTSFGVSEKFDAKFSKFITGDTFGGTIPAKYVADNYVATEANGKTTVSIKKANYSKVDVAIAEAENYAEADYTVESYAKLTEAIDAIVEDLDYTKQADVDKMADDIMAAIEALVEKPVTVLPEVDTTEKVEEITVGVTDKEATEELLFSELEKSDIDTEDKNVAISVSALPVKEEEVDKTTVGAITDTVKDNFTKGVVGGFFDVSIFVVDKETNNQLGQLTDLSKSIKLSVVLPEELKTVEEGYTRTYYIIRYHDGKAEIIKNATLSKDGNSLEFESNKFSVYAIAYEDVKAEEVASTYDGVGAYVAMGLISLVSLAGASLYLKKRIK